MDLAGNGATLALRIGMLRDPALATVPFVALGDSEDEAHALGAHGFARWAAPAENLLRIISQFATMRAPLPV